MDVDAVRVLEAVAREGLEFGVEPVELVMGPHAVSRGGPHAEQPFLPVRRGGRAAVLGDDRLAPCRFAEELPKEIEEMGIEIDEPLVSPVFAAETVHAGPARLPDPALPDHRDGLALDFGRPRQGWAMINRTPARSQAATMASTSAGVRASGFSAYTWTPRRRRPAPWRDGCSSRGWARTTMSAPPAPAFPCTGHIPGARRCAVTRPSVPLRPDRPGPAISAPSTPTKAWSRECP